ncbi:MAG TPA: PIN domain-containing protein [Syntrophales bacterium]|nr:PIN domain-containing protein [Syntrophales bacterium]HON23407.1 PIN domain-containing protein [Syntrophales bacterium]HOU76951.1 PIN domain-containing protein [Syntrophales bacterium]HPC31720.1 PIN domain-containing protein [Syntrophales bacterium]HRU87767.1 PIN domain-containing protein [Syntrophales bacterium]
MKILVDTSIWSLALRRSAKLSEKDRSLVQELNELISEVRVAIIGPVRQELLSGISIKTQFEALKEMLAAFDDMPLRREDYERAAEFYNTCRKAGIQGSQIDFLICAVAAGRELPIFTTDNDFLLYAKHLPISLHRPFGRP